MTNLAPDFPKACPMRPTLESLRHQCNRIFTGVAVAIWLFCQIATADELSQVDKAPSWEFGGGIAGMYVPDYHGSDEYRVYVSPVPYIVHRGEKLRIDEGGATGKILSSDTFKIDLSFGAGMPVNRTSKARTGMEPLNPTLETGPLLTVLLSGNEEANLSLNLAIREVISVSLTNVVDRGRVLAPNLKYNAKTSSSWNHYSELSLLISPTFGSEKYHQYYYGVKQEYATQERPAFAARSGYQGTRATVAYKIRQKRHWWGGFMQYETLKGAVFRDSPLVKSQRFFAVGLATAWILTERE